MNHDDDWVKQKEVLSFPRNLAHVYLVNNIRELGKFDIVVQNCERIDFKFEIRDILVKNNVEKRPFFQ